MSEPLFPLFLRLADRPVLVVGAGPLGSGKIAELLQVAAKVTVIAPEASAQVRALAEAGRIVWHARRFEAADLAQLRPYLVIAATGDADVHASVCQAAEQSRTFAVALDEPAYGSAFFGAILRRPPFLVAISSHGQAPALTRLLREILEQVLPADDVVHHARTLRARWRAERLPMGQRFGSLVRELAERSPS